MEHYDIITLLTNDYRFVRSGTALQLTSQSLSEIFSSDSIVSLLNESLHALKNAARFLNLLMYANIHKDSLVSLAFTEQVISDVLSKGTDVLEYSDISDIQLKDALGDKYIDFKTLGISVNAVSAKSEFISQLLNRPSSLNSNLQHVEASGDYWIQSVNLDYPAIPQPNGLKTVENFTYNNQNYCIYDESFLPRTQSQISAVSDINKFSDSDILKLFPPIRLYTRSPYMYKEYEGIDYDSDLGVIFKISGFNVNQIKKNIIEYPHLEFLERTVKLKGKDTTIPFWKYIEIDGEIVSTSAVWDTLKDTKKLPKTESFMAEYVIRRYLLERAKGVEHKYEMRGDLQPFLTLYAPASYYQTHKYDPIDVGKKCVESRIAFKRSRNPILKALKSVGEIE